MVNRELIEAAEAFLRKTFAEGTLKQQDPYAAEYRVGHSVRAARIARKIAEAEGFDETEMMLALLLHDISYSKWFETRDEWVAHGRSSAAIARGFLKDCGLAEARIQDICYGIAIHVDGDAGFAGEETKFALSVSDADNIERFDSYRIHETLVTEGFLSLTPKEKEEYTRKKLEFAEQMRSIHCATDTAEAMWKEIADRYEEFFARLNTQMHNSLCALDPQ